MRPQGRRPERRAALGAPRARTRSGEDHLVPHPADRLHHRSLHPEQAGAARLRRLHLRGTGERGQGGRGARPGVARALRAGPRRHVHGDRGHRRLYQRAHRYPSRGPAGGHAEARGAGTEARGACSAENSRRGAQASRRSAEGSRRSAEGSRGGGSSLCTGPAGCQSSRSAEVSASPGQGRGATRRRSRAGESCRAGRAQGGGSRPRRNP